MEKNENGGGIAKTPKQRMEVLMSGASFQKSLQDVIPKHITSDRIVKIALVAMSRQPKLFECTPQSVLQSVMKSAELGLDCVGTLGQGYLVPYYNGSINALECQFIPGYQGLISLARRSGEISRIESRVVYANDIFDFEYGLNQKLVHKPSLTGERGDITCVYAIAEIKEGGQQLEIMTIDEVNGIMGRSKSRNRNKELVGPWVTDFSEMARKTVIRRICKYLPLSAELSKAFEADNKQFDYDRHNAVAESTQLGAAGLKDRLKEQAEKTKQVDSTTVEPEPEPDFIKNPPEQQAKKTAEQIEKEKQIEELATVEEAERTAEDKFGTDEPPQEEPPQEEPQECRYFCKDCDNEFDERKKKKDGAGGFNYLCPGCLSDNVMDRRPAAE